MFIEDKKQHGNVVFKFIRSPEELKKWKDKGYVLKGEHKDVNAKLIHTLSTWWKRATWKDQNLIYAQSIKNIPGANGESTYSLDMIRFRDLKLKTCLKRWDLTNDEGNIIDVTPEVIDNLDPSFAAELLSNFERITEASDEEKKD